VNAHPIVAATVTLWEVFRDLLLPASIVTSCLWLSERWRRREG
jgi:hypothetical protein